jgi:hypothetical protein
MAVALDAVMTGGNQGDTIAADNATSFTDSDAITLGAGATLLEVVVNWQSPDGVNVSPTNRVVTWNGVSLTEQVYVVNTAALNIDDACGIYGLVSPATGAQTLAGSWTNTMDAYIGAISFTGTDTSTGINAGDSVSGTAATIDVAGSSDGATLSTWLSNGSEPTTNNTKFWGYAALDPGGAGQYEVGGSGTITHTYSGGGGSNPVIAAVHVIAGAAGTPGNTGQPLLSGRRNSRVVTSW